MYLYHTFQRYRTLHTHRITSLPIAILMPHSACNCRCVMCDIWKGNGDRRSLTEADVAGLLSSLKRLGTRQVLLSGGEALLHPNLFHLCALLRGAGMKISLLSTGLPLEKHAAALARNMSEIIVSLDGDEALHDAIRRVPGAYARMRKGIAAIRTLSPAMRITGRTVIHRLNFRNWNAIVDAAHELDLDQISFLPADVTSSAFNRAEPWDADRQEEVALPIDELPELNTVLENLLVHYRDDLERGFIAESTTKLRQIVQYYRALQGLDEFPHRRCNAPWVSAVIEPDGSVRPCFFHEPVGNIRQGSLQQALNGRKGLQFRKELDMRKNDTCRRCVCSLYLPPFANPVQTTRA